MEQCYVTSKNTDYCQSDLSYQRELCEKWDSGSREVVAELRALLPDVERLGEAAQMHAKKGHNDTCSLAWCGDRCDCGYAIAVAALALFNQPQSRHRRRNETR